MNFEHTEDRRMLADTLNRFVAEQYGFETRNAIAYGDVGMQPALWAQFAELGAIGALFPEAEGGFGGAGFDVAVVFEALGIAVLGTLRESLVAIYADRSERSGIMAILQTIVMLISVPFGYIGGLLSNISRILPFVLSIMLLLLGMLATALYHRQSSNAVLPKT